MVRNLCRSWQDCNRGAYALKYDPRQSSSSPTPRPIRLPERCIAFMTASVPAGVQQCASCVLLVRPARFGYNIQTADSNHFQHRAAAFGPIAALARAEFDLLCDCLL